MNREGKALPWRRFQVKLINGLLSLPIKESMQTQPNMQNACDTPVHLYWVNTVRNQKSSSSPANAKENG